MTDFQTWARDVAAEQTKLSGASGTINGSGEYRQLWREGHRIAEAARLLNMAGDDE